MAGSRPPLFVRLYQTAGAWGLPSTCASCIAAQALLRSTGLPLSLISGAAPGMTTAHTLPVAVFLRGDDPSAHGSPDLLPDPAGRGRGGGGGGKRGGDLLPPPSPGMGAAAPPAADTSVAVGVAGIVAALAARGVDVDAGLSPVMRAEAAAFAALAARDWAPARTAEYWVDRANYEDLLHTVLLPSSPHPWPLSRLAIAARRRAAVAAVAATLPPPLGAALSTEAGAAAGAPPRAALTARAAGAVAALAARLGGGGGGGTFYRSATSPLTSLDAVVYGELAAVLYAPLPANGLRAVIAAHPTLVAFCATVRGAHFGDPTEGGAGGDRVVHEANLADYTSASRLVYERSQRRVEELDGVGVGGGGATKAGAASTMSDEEREHARGNRWFVGFAVAAFGAYLLWGDEIEVVGFG